MLLHTIRSGIRCVQLIHVVATQLYRNFFLQWHLLRLTLTLQIRSPRAVMLDPTLQPPLLDMEIAYSIQYPLYLWVTNNTIVIIQGPTIALCDVMSKCFFTANEIDFSSS